MDTHVEEASRFRRNEIRSSSTRFLCGLAGDVSLIRRLTFTCPQLVAPAPSCHSKDEHEMVTHSYRARVKGPWLGLESCRRKQGEEANKGIAVLLEIRTHRSLKAVNRSRTLTDGTGCPCECAACPVRHCGAAAGWDTAVVGGSGSAALHSPYLQGPEYLNSGFPITGKCYYKVSSST